MKETRRRFEWFSFYDHTGLEAHLERMAEQGWLLESIGSFTWNYRRTEPKKLTYSVCYYPKATQFDPGPSEEQETFYDFCAHTGWTLAAASAQMQVFYNERENPVPIDTDPALEVDAIHQAAKRGWLISQLLLLAVGVMNFGQFLWQLFVNPITTLSSALYLFAVVCWPVLFLIIGMDTATYFRWRRRALKAAAQGEFLATRSHPVFQKLALAVVLAGLVWCLSYLQDGMLAVMAVSLIGTLGIVFVIVQVRELLRRQKVPAGINRVITYGACVVLPLIMIVLVTAFVFSTAGRGGAESVQLPLTLDDLMETPAEWELDHGVNLSQSPLLSELAANQYVWRGRDAGSRWLQYKVTVVKAPYLYDVCKNHLLGKNENRDTDFLPIKYYEPIDPAPWGAQEAYQFMMGEEDVRPQDTYLLCYPDRIVVFEPDWEPTPEQMAVVAEKLGGV